MKAGSSSTMALARPRRPGETGPIPQGAVLLAHEDPSRVLPRSKVPLFSPLTDFECNGFVPNVVFPTGIVAENRSLLIYYGTPILLRQSSECRSTKC